jgi:DNA-directed RNA polymerase specialized sigma24 family protein
VTTARPSARRADRFGEVPEQRADVALPCAAVMHASVPLRGARRYGMRHLRDGDAAADLMQHVMALTIEQLRSGALREPERVASFVLGACRRTAIEQRRVADCLDRLPERERSVS